MTSILRLRRAPVPARALSAVFGVQGIAVKEIIPDNVVVIPRADFVIKDSDVLVVIGEEKELAKI